MDREEWKINNKRDIRAGIAQAKERQKGSFKWRGKGPDGWTWGEPCVKGGREDTGTLKV